MPKTVVVTTCSANHLAQAKGLGESVLKHNPGYIIMVGLVDRLEGRVPPVYYEKLHIVEAHTLAIPEFEKMRVQYSVFELNCALKCFFAADAFDRFGADKVIFLDTDMLVFNSLQYLEDELDRHPLLLTPHIWTPFPMDNKRPFEREMLKNGIYNAGFFAIKDDDVGKSFLKWWMQRMIDQCYVELKEGMFVDQKWLNLAPLFFPQAKLLDHPGCNVAYWNLHERKVVKKEGRFTVNEEPLLFYHYSGYSMKEPGLISRHQDRVQMEDQPALKELFSIYQEALIRNEHVRIQELSCYYKKKASLLERFGKKR